MTDPRDEPSILSEIQPFSWSSEDSVAYETAIEAINGAVGAYTALIAAEEAKQHPDQDVITQARAGRAECAQRRKGLDPADHVAVAETRQRFSQLAEEVRERCDR